MNKAMYERIMAEVDLRLLTDDTDTFTYSRKIVLHIVDVSIKVAIAEELLNRNGSKSG